MKRSDLPYFAVTTDEKGCDIFLIGGRAQATYLDARVENCAEIRTGEANVPHLVIRLPLSKFERIDWSVLGEITAEERREQCPA